MQLIIALALSIALFVPLSAWGHGNHNNQCTGPHSNDPGCDNGDDDPPTKTFDIVIASDNPSFGFWDSDGRGPYRHGDQFVTIEQNRHFVSFVTGPNGPEKKKRDITVDLGTPISLGSIVWQATAPGELDGLVVIGSDRGQDPANSLNDLALDKPEPTTLFMRGHNFGESATLIISFDDPITTDYCAPLNSNGDRVEIERTEVDEWVVTVPAMTNACAFLFNGTENVGDPALIAMDEGFTLTITER